MGKTKKRYKPRSGPRFDQISLLFGFTEDCLRSIDTESRLNLQAFIDGVATPKEWLQLLTRIANGRELAVHYFNDEPCRVLHGAVVEWVRVYKDFCANNEKWNWSERIQHEISDALDLVDQIHRSVTRKQYVAVFNNAVDATTGELDDLMIPYEEYLVVRAYLLKKHGRKVTLS